MLECDVVYSELHRLGREVKVLGSIKSLLEWDQETYMPHGGSLLRADQLKVMAGLHHRARTGPQFTEALAALIDLKTGELLRSDLKEAQQSAVREWHRDWKRESALPESFVEEFAALTSEALEIWKVARQNNDYKSFAPYLKRIVEYSRRQADYIGYKENRYDALLDIYEPGATTAEISKLFKKIRDPIVELLKRIRAAEQVDNSQLKVLIDEGAQLSFGRELLKSIGFDFNNGVFSLSTHPFCNALHPADCRVTSRIHPEDPFSNIKTVLHEGGHALYEMHLPPSEYGSPLGEAVSLGVHESQSRWWETYIGLSRPFWSHWLPRWQTHCQGLWPQASLDSFLKAINRVEPSFIRVEADEVCYPLHVILRFELEQELINGTLDVADLPEAWNAKMSASLGITPPNDRLGCLQDVHWAMGGFGYFSTYLLGNAYAAHLFFEGFEKIHPNWRERLARGEMDFIGQWLKEEVHSHGRRYTPMPLLERATGKPFSEQAYLRYLTTKYGEVYQLT